MLSTSRSRTRCTMICAADVLAVVRVRDAFALEHLAELVGRQLVLLGDAQDRALDGRVVDADAVLLRVLQQRALDDQALEHLLVEHVGRRRRDLRRLHLRQHDAALLVQVVLRDRLVVDDGEHAVERHRVLTARRAAAAGGAAASLRASDAQAAGDGADTQRGSTDLMRRCLAIGRVEPL